MANNERTWFISHGSVIDRFICLLSIWNCLSMVLHWPTGITRMVDRPMLERFEVTVFWFHFKIGVNSEGDRCYLIHRWDNWLLSTFPSYFLQSILTHHPAISGQRTLSNLPKQMYPSIWKSLEHVTFFSMKFRRIWSTNLYNIQI